MVKKIQTFVLFVLLITFCCAVSSVHAAAPANASTTAGVDGDYIRVNQVGYLSSDTKVAIAFSNTSLSTQTFSIINSNGGATLFGPAALVATSAYAPFTYLYNENFSAFQPTAAVTCYVQDSDGTKSIPFVVGPCVYQSTVAAAVNFYRGQNCGTGNGYGGTTPGGAAAQADCHMAPGTAGWTTDEDGMVVDGPNKGTTLNVEGGLHDSGDWIKFMITMAWVDEGILFAYQNNPTVFGDIYGSNLQPGGNSVPDVLDEGRYILNWIIQMNPNATTFYYDVADGRDHDNFGNLASTDTENYDTTTANEGNGDPYGAVAKPYRPVYGGTNDQGGTNNAARAAGALAMGYQIWNASGTTFQDTTFAASCLQHAEWLYALAKSENYTQVDVDDFYPVNTLANYADYPEMEMAAVQLYKATGTGSYLTDAQTFAPNVGSAGGELDWSANNFLAHLCLYQVAPTTTILGYMQADLNADLARYNAAGNPYGVDYAYAWGGMEDQTSSVFMCQEWKKLNPTDTTYDAMGTYNRDWLLGRNPWGCCFIQGLGTVYSLHPQHNIAMAIYPTIITGGAIEGPCDYNDYSSQGSILTGGEDPYAAFDNNKAGGWVYHDDNGDYVSNEITSTQSMWNLNVLANLAAASCSTGATATNTPAVTKTFTPTLTMTRTLTATGTPTPTPTRTPTATNTNTSSPTVTPTLTNTFTFTATASLTKTNTLTWTRTPTSSSTVTYTNTPVPPSPTATVTLSPTASFTNTPVPLTPTMTSSPTFSRTFTPVNTVTWTPSPVNTATSTLTATGTIPATLTPTNTLVPPTLTLTLTETNTPIPPTRTPTSTSTATGTSTWTSTSTYTPPVLTPTFTSTRTWSPTFTSTLTWTATNTLTATRTLTPVFTNTFTLTPTWTLTRTNTPVPTNTLTATATRTSSPTLTATPSASPTPTVLSGCSGVAVWNGNFVSYALGARVTYNEVLYQCIQAHTSEPTWEPPVVPALWKNLGACSGVAGKITLTSAVSYPNPSTTGNATLYYKIQGLDSAGNTLDPSVTIEDPNATVTLKIYSLASRMVWSRILSGQDAVSGEHNFAWNGKDMTGVSLANGVYYYMVTLKSQGNSNVKKSPLLILR